jgi:hypothetical protein
MYVFKNLKTLEKGLSSKKEKVYWRAATDLSDYVKDSPELIWPMVVKYGSRGNSDLQSAIGCCVLEHILGYHFKEYFPKIEKFVLVGNRNFRETLKCCWKSGQSREKRNSIRWDKLIYDSAMPKEKEFIDFWCEYKKYKEMEKRGDPEGTARLRRFNEVAWIQDVADYYALSLSRNAAKAIRDEISDTECVDLIDEKAPPQRNLDNFQKFTDRVLAKRKYESKIKSEIEKIKLKIRSKKYRFDLKEIKEYKRELKERLAKEKQKLLRKKINYS